MQLKTFCALGVLLTLSALAADAKPDAPKPKPPNAARSVHLGYSLPDGVNEAALFYIEESVEQSTSNTYFMAAGFNAGYFGVQELGKGKKIALFSIWDPGNQNDPNSVKAENRVKVLFGGEGVNVRRFGGEGTGGQSMYPFDWKLNERLKFIVACKADGKSSTYSGYLWLPELKEWKKLATFQTTAHGAHLSGLYSFIEDFRRDTKSIDDSRRARYGNQWIRTLEGNWLPLTKARFTGDSTPLKNNNADLTPEGDFYLTTGGDAKRTRALNSLISKDTKPTEPPEIPQTILDDIKAMLKDPNEKTEAPK